MNTSENSADQVDSMTAEDPAQETGFINPMVEHAAAAAARIAVPDPS